MKVLIIQDQMLTKGGSERVFSYLADIFPEADLFTVAYNKKTTIRFKRENDLKTSIFFNKIIKSHKVFKFFFPLLTFYYQFKNFNNYDMIISSSATCAKYIRNFSGIHICYCYVPTRAIWEVDNYFPKENFVKFFFKIFLPVLKKRDLNTSNYINLYIGDSRDCAKRIRKIYKGKTSYAYSPIDYQKYSSYFSNKKEEYYLVVSRFDYWKRVDIAVDAFNSNGEKLYIVGSGEAYDSLKKSAKSNITFLTDITDDELGKLYSHAKGVVFTCDIEHGLIPIEANACGTPVICYGFGGVEDTMINFNGSNQDHATAVFFNEQNELSLNNAIKIFENINFNKENIMKNAKRFSIEIFNENVEKIINSYLKKEKVILNEIK